MVPHAERHISGGPAADVALTPGARPHDGARRRHVRNLSVESNTTSPGLSPPRTRKASSEYDTDPTPAPGESPKGRRGKKPRAPRSVVRSTESLDPRDKEKPRRQSSVRQSMNSDEQPSGKPKTTGDAGPVVVLATVLLKAEQQAAQERRNQEAEEAFIAAMQRLQTTVDDVEHELDTEEPGEHRETLLERHETLLQEMERCTLAEAARREEHIATLVVLSEDEKRVAHEVRAKRRERSRNPSVGRPEAEDRPRERAVVRYASPKEERRALRLALEKQAAIEQQQRESQEAAERHQRTRRHTQDGIDRLSRKITEAAQEGLPQAEQLELMEAKMALMEGLGKLEDEEEERRRKAGETPELRLDDEELRLLRGHWALQQQQQRRPEEPPRNPAKEALKGRIDAKAEAANAKEARRKQAALRQLARQRKEMQAAYNEARRTFERELEEIDAQVEGDEEDEETGDPEQHQLLARRAAVLQSIEALDERTREQDAALYEKAPVLTRDEERLLRGLDALGRVHGRRQAQPPAPPAPAPAPAPALDSKGEAPAKPAEVKPTNGKKPRMRAAQLVSPDGEGPKAHPDRKPGQPAIAPKPRAADGVAPQRRPGPRCEPGDASSPEGPRCREAAGPKAALKAAVQRRKGLQLALDGVEARLRAAHLSDVEKLHVLQEKVRLLTAIEGMDEEVLALRRQDLHPRRLAPLLAGSAEGGPGGEAGAGEDRARGWKASPLGAAGASAKPRSLPPLRPADHGPAAALYKSLPQAAVRLSDEQLMAQVAAKLKCLAA